jgi:hypothetical protein
MRGKSETIKVRDDGACDANRFFSASIIEGK